MGDGGRLPVPSTLRLHAVDAKLSALASKEIALKAKQTDFMTEIFKAANAAGACAWMGLGGWEAGGVVRACLPARPPATASTTAQMLFPPTPPTPARPQKHGRRRGRI